MVDDHPMFLEGIAGRIQSQPDWEVCAHAETAEQAFDAVLQTQPDIVITNITLPEKSGLDLVKDIHAMMPAVPILVISVHDERFYATRVLAAGARGLVTKRASGEAIIKAVRRILAGEVYVSQEASQQILQTFSNGRNSNRSGDILQLSDREFEVFHLIGQGLSIGEIARRLHLSIKTVQTHRANIKAKLDAKTYVQLVSYAATWLVYGISGNNH